MTKETLAQLEHISQLLILQTGHIKILIDEVWHDFELLRSDLREFIAVHEEWEKSNVFNPWRQK
ncbi:MAG: hypothetical protein B7Y25_08265 [Alphaproteobacteria bacterium 16-39-46]|nr:MAG: hypothetical protein B7Y25_08265 [Alphaproteobacteria bacterium 16-39-46]OZA41205.1 MAG: hypothetical protein B7X84_08395 [Alphaproteobacteria bacterium 17-39-52]HQS84661.1 hypothetical protein [Alphaproteobacteria bacterium]HQS93124.1 hypothetical protein [Alphaproteobacteria bacterium]